MKGKIVTSHKHPKPVKVSPRAEKSFSSIEKLNTCGNHGNTRFTSLKHGGRHA